MVQAEKPESAILQGATSATATSIKDETAAAAASADEKDPQLLGKEPNKNESMPVVLSDKPPPVPVYRQYIMDRIKGYSYIPQSQRGGNRVILPPTDSAQHILDTMDAEDEKDCCLNGDRPPHWLCFVPPCVGKYPGCLEQNAFCEWTGKIGLQAFKTHPIRRRRLFFIGFTFNLMSLALLIVAGMAYSRNYRLLSHTSFARGYATATLLEGNITNATVEATIDIGLRGFAISDPSGYFGGDNVDSYDFLCEQEKPLLNPAICGECRDTAGNFAFAILLNIIVVLKNLFSDIQRQYPRYDLNCPNFVGSLMASLSVFLGLWTINTYNDRCFSHFTEDFERWSLEPFNSIMPDDVLDDLQVGAVRIEFDWSAGPGLICMAVATLLRLVDAFANFLVPTPSITRNQELQQEYERNFGERKNFKETDEQSTPLNMAKDDENVVFAEEGGDGTKEDSAESQV